MMAVQQKRRSWTAFTTPIFLAVSIITLAILEIYRRSMADLFTDLKGGSSTGLALAYAGSLSLVAAQFYTIVKRSGWIGFMKKMAEHTHG